MKNFEDNLKKLEELTASIRRSDISLEEALKDFEEGIKLAKGMEKELDAIEGKIQILMDTGEFDENESDEDSDDSEKNTKEKKSRKAKSKKDDGPTLELFNPSNEVNGTRNG